MKRKETTNDLGSAAPKNCERHSFVVECAGRPLLAFAAADLVAARKFMRVPWLAQELAIYRSCGTPIWDGKMPLTLRPATLSEHEEVLVATAIETARDQDTKFVFVFLVPIDPERH